MKDEQFSKYNSAEGKCVDLFTFEIINKYFTILRKLQSRLIKYIKSESIIYVRFDIINFISLYYFLFPCYTEKIKLI